MNDAHNVQGASNAASALARRRWGSQRLDRLADELADRADELTPGKRDELVQALVDTSDEGPEAA